MKNVSYEIPDWCGSKKDLKKELNKYKLKLVKLIENNVNRNLQPTICGEEKQVKKFILDHELDDLFDDQECKHYMNPETCISCEQEEENPYLEWSEDSISEELFELKQWIVEDWLDRVSTTNDDNYKKYHLLNNALEVVDQDNITAAKVVNLLNGEK